MKVASTLSWRRFATVFQESTCALHLLLTGRSRRCRNLARVLKQLPALQRERHVDVVPDKVVELQHGKVRALLQARLRQQLNDLQLADLVGDRLPRRA